MSGLHAVLVREHKKLAIVDYDEEDENDNNTCEIRASKFDLTASRS
jgi:hypothetical protein